MKAFFGVECNWRRRDFALNSRIKDGVEGRQLSVDRSINASVEDVGSIFCSMLRADFCGFRQGNLSVGLSVGSD